MLAVPLKRRYRFVQKLLEKLKTIPDDQQKHRDIITAKLLDLKKEIQDYKRSHDTCTDRAGIIAQINALRSSGRLTFTHPVEDGKYTTEELQAHLEWCKRKTAWQPKS